MKILIVEDNKELAENISKFLSLEGSSTEIAYDGQRAISLILEYQYDCVVLDLNLPKLDGTEVCRIVRENNISTPIIILTATTSKDSLIYNLKLGADDYLRKPFEMDELVARITSLIRRSKKIVTRTIEISDIQIYLDRKEVRKKKKIISLSPKEYKLLEFLAINRNKAMDRTQILENVWNDYDELLFSQTVDVHIAYLRKKLGKEIIETVPGGYIIKD